MPKREPSRLLPPAPYPPPISDCARAIKRLFASLTGPSADAPLAAARRRSVAAPARSPAAARFYGGYPPQAADPRRQRVTVVHRSCAAEARRGRPSLRQKGRGSCPGHGIVNQCRGVLGRPARIGEIPDNAAILAKFWTRQVENRGLRAGVRGEGGGAVYRAMLTKDDSGSTLAR
jgi:hypothetical protein